jgi:hypothetical protein
MATAAERMKGLRERERRELRHEQQAQAVSRFITDALAARLDR